MLALKELLGYIGIKKREGKSKEWRVKNHG